MVSEALSLVLNWYLSCCYVKPYVPLNYFGSNGGNSIRNHYATVQHKSEDIRGQNEKCSNTVSTELL